MQLLTRTLSRAGQDTTRFSVVELQPPPNTHRPENTLKTPHASASRSFNFRLTFQAHNRLQFVILTMKLPPFKALEAAYQLHFYLGFKTHYLLPLLRTAGQRAVVSKVLEDVCAREQYHLLETNITDDYLRLLVSLNPEQTVSNTVKMLKGNLSRQYGLAFRDELECQKVRTLWAKGYFARSTGKVNLEAARNYVDTQLRHHGYSGEWTKALKYRNPAFKSPAFSLAHCFCTLDYHLVLVTKFRAPLFDEAMAAGLFDYVMAVGRKHGFVVERMVASGSHASTHSSDSWLEYLPVCAGDLEQYAAVDGKALLGRAETN